MGDTLTHMKRLLILCVFLSMACTLGAQEGVWGAWNVGPGALADLHWRAPVASLPATGNVAADARIRTSDFTAWVWNGAAWVPMSTSVPGGSDTEVQYNCSGAFCGDSGFIFDDVSKDITTAGDLTIAGDVDTGGAVKTTGAGQLFRIRGTGSGGYLASFGSAGSGYGTIQESPNRGFTWVNGDYMVGRDTCLEFWDSLTITPTETSANIHARLCRQSNGILELTDGPGTGWADIELGSLITNGPVSDADGDTSIDLDGDGTDSDVISFSLGGVEAARFTTGIEVLEGALPTCDGSLAKAGFAYFTASTDGCFYGCSDHSGSYQWEKITCQTTSKSFNFSARPTSNGVFFIAGGYTASSTEAELDEGSLTVTHGTANGAYGAHAYAVSGGNGSTDGSDLVLTVSGTSITDAAVRTPGDSEVVVATATSSAVDTYYETSKKWNGQVTYTLSSSGGSTFNYDFNYGFGKYDDLYNTDFIITDFECAGLADKNDAGFDLELMHHSQTGWTYAATGFVPGNSVLNSMNTDYSTEQNLIVGEPFAYKRTGLSHMIDGDMSEGFLIRVTTSVNGSVTYMDCHVGVLQQ